MNTFWINYLVVGITAFVILLAQFKKNPCFCIDGTYTKAIVGGLAVAIFLTAVESIKTLFVIVGCSFLLIIVLKMKKSKGGLMAKKNNSWKMLALVIVGSIMVAGFLNIYDELVKESIVDVITLFTIPSIIGALIIKSEYKSNGKWFLFSTASLFAGLLLVKAGGGSLIEAVSGFFLLAGTFAFVFNLLVLLVKLHK